MRKLNVVAIIICTLLILGLLVGFKYWNDYRTERSRAAADAISRLTISFVEDDEDDKAGEEKEDGEEGEEGEEAEEEEKPKNVFEYGDRIIKTKDLVKSYGGELSIDVEEIDCSKVGSTTVTYLLTTQDIYGRTFTSSEVVTYTVKDTAFPEIELDKDEISVEWGSEVDLNENVISVTDPIDGEIDIMKSEDDEDEDENTPKDADAEEEPSIKEPDNGTYVIDSTVDTSKSGEYTVTVRAKDKNGNLTEKEFTVIVGAEPNQETDAISDPEDTSGMATLYNGMPYQIRVNRIANTITVYTPDADGYYSVPYKSMVCSCSATTPLGQSTVGNKWAWVGIYGNSYAQYATQFYGNFMFQSVIYNSENPGDLDWEEYNKLGTSAYTQGSVWLTCGDAKWIYDNAGAGTEVWVYDDSSNPGPLGTPIPPHINPDSPNRGWDPTDTNSGNPW